MLRGGFFGGKLSALQSLKVKVFPPFEKWFHIFIAILYNSTCVCATLTAHRAPPGTSRINRECECDKTYVAIKPLFIFIMRHVENVRCTQRIFSHSHETREVFFFHSKSSRVKREKNDGNSARWQCLEGVMWWKRWISVVCCEVYIYYICLIWDGMLFPLANILTQQHVVHKHLITFHIIREKMENIWGIRRRYHAMATDRGIIPINSTSFFNFIDDWIFSVYYKIKKRRNNFLCRLNNF